MPPLSGKQRKAQLKLKRAIKRGDASSQQPDLPQKRKKKASVSDRAVRSARSLQSEFVKLDKTFLDDTRALAGTLVLRRPIPSDISVLRHEWIIPSSSTLSQPAIPRRPKWKYQMSKEELDANEQAYFRTWLAQQDAIVEQWQQALNAPSSTVSPAAGHAINRVDVSETHTMPHPPTHFERNIEVWRQFWRVSEISQILLVLLDSRCPLLHLPTSLSTHLNIPTSAPAQDDLSSRSQRSKVKTLRIILVLTKVDISGPTRTASWTAYLNANYPSVPVVPVEAYAPQSSHTVEQGPTRYEPHLPGSFRERLVHTLKDIHGQLLQPPEWVTSPRPNEGEEKRLERIALWGPKVKKVIDWDGVLKAKGNLVGKAVGGAAMPKGQGVEREADGAEDEDANANDISEEESEEEQEAEVHGWKEPEYLTVGVIGQPNVGKSSLLNAIFGKVRVRASRTPGKTKHFQTLFWTSDVRLVDCPGLVMPSFVPMDIQVLSGVLPISRIAAVPFCVHQLARFLPLEQILELTHPSLSISPATATEALANDHGSSSQCSRSMSNPLSKSKSAPVNPVSAEDKRTWRPGQRPLEQTKVQPSAPKWTANDIMTAYANKKGWVTAKAGRPDVHRAGNAILRLVAEGKIPWAFWPLGSLGEGNDGIWLNHGVRQHTLDEPDMDDSDQEAEVEELTSEECMDTWVKIAKGETYGGDEDEDEGEDEDEEKPMFHGENIGRFSALRIE